MKWEKKRDRCTKKVFPPSTIDKVSLGGQNIYIGSDRIRLKASHFFVLTPRPRGFQLHLFSNAISGFDLNQKSLVLARLSVEVEKDHVED